MLNMRYKQADDGIMVPLTKQKAVFTATRLLPLAIETTATLRRERGLHRVNLESPTRFR